MHNGTSHDEDGNPDRWVMTARYAVAAAMYGAPMVFMGQPLGQGAKMAFRDRWENMYQRWSEPDPERDRVAAMYKRINLARRASPELSAPSRYFLNTEGGGLRDRIFAVARWVDAGASDSVVLVFVNLSSSSGDAATFVVPTQLRLSGDYQAINLVADDPNATVWPTPRTADEIHAFGVYVRFSLPNEVQYLRLIPV
jgi:hypothetical protein